MTSSLPLTRGRRLALIAGVPIAIALAGWGALNAVAFLGHATYSVNRSIPWSGGAVSIAIDDGDVSVTPSTDGTVHVFGVVDYSLVKPTLDITSTGSTVTIGSSCRVIVIGRCAVHITVAVPPSASVTATSRSGDVAASDLSDVTLRSDSGDLQATRLGGLTELRTDSGDITATDLRSSSVTASDASGDVALGFSVIPQQVVIGDSSGDVDLSLPSGSQAYNVTAHSSSGDTTIGVPTDPSSTDTVSVSVASGDIQIEPTG